MKFMLMRKADSETEQGILPTDELFKAMLEYNDRMIQAGVFLFGNGLRPTSEGCRIVFRNGQPEVLRGPFTPPGEQLAGYSVLEVDSLEQAIEWARQWPTLDSNGNAVLELRRYFEPGDFAPGPLVEAHQQQLKMPVEVNIHLGFPGTYREAMTFYHQTIGGTLEALITYGETPAAAEVPPEAADLIIHGSLNIRGRRLMGADMAGECQQVAQGTCIHLEYDDQDRAAEVFDQLQQGGQVTMPFAETFWASRFGMVTDRFGISWMIGYGTGRSPQTPLEEVCNP